MFAHVSFIWSQSNLPSKFKVVHSWHRIEPFMVAYRFYLVPGDALELDLVTVKQWNVYGHTCGDSQG